MDREAWWATVLGVTKSWTRLKKRLKLNTLRNKILKCHFLMRWMKLEPIIQNEVSQKEKHQYSILMHIYEI